MSPCDQLKTYLHIHNNYGYQTMQCGSIQWTASVNKVSDLLITWFCKDTHNLIRLYLYYHKTSGHKNWHGAELLEGASTHEDPLPFEHVAFWDQAAN